MTFVLDDRVRESSVNTGTGPLTLAGAIPGYQAFSAVMSIGDTCWYAIVLPGVAWETGVGTYTGVNTLTRTTVLRSSNAGAAVSFGAGTKDVFIALPASKGNVRNNSFDPGTLMLFQQSTAPTYWTKQVTHNDKALRVVSGAASSGGTNAFSAAFNASNVVNGHTLTIAEMPAHGHSYNAPALSPGTGTSPDYFLAAQSGSTTGSTGGDGPHNHAYNINVAYVDLIIASKD